MGAKVQGQLNLATTRLSMPEDPKIGANHLYSDFLFIF
jgi:hypothetical protein